MSKPSMVSAVLWAAVSHGAGDGAMVVFRSGSGGSLMPAWAKGTQLGSFEMDRVVNRRGWRMEEGWKAGAGEGQVVW